MRVAYIAGPYRPNNGRTVLENVRLAEQVAIKYWRLGYAVICPHKNTEFFDGLCPDNVWLEGDLEIVKRVDVVVAMENYKDSSGAIAEIELAKSMGKVIIYDVDGNALGATKKENS